MNLKHHQKVKLVQEAFQLIKAQKGYSQVNILKKMDLLGFKTSPSTFNKIIKNKPVGEEILTLVLNGIKALLQHELCFVLSDDLTWELEENSQANTISIDKAEKKNFVIHEEGRLKLEEKVSFFSTAQTEIIEFGITLNSFSNYFMSQRESVFKKPIQQLLEKGVHFKCFLLDPNWSGTILYFEDRKTSVQEGTAGIDKIKASLRKLKIVHQEFAALNMKGTFEVFTYKHIPQNYFLGIDISDKKEAKMMTSNYLFGQKRADCPVMEFRKMAHPTLFRRYVDSLEKVIKGAKKVDFSKI